jgi:hypothetical protein
MKYLKSTFLEQLKRDIPRNVDCYCSSSPWLEAYAKSQRYALETNLSLPQSFKLHPPTATGQRRDIENVRLVFDALRDLTPVQASDPRFWTYLTHVTFWEYMRTRWDINSVNDDQKTEYILGHYFVRTGSSRSLIRNGIASLWWYGYLTYDPERANPYELTSILLKKLDIARNLLERNLGRNRIILHSFLEFLLEHPEMTDVGNEGRHAVRALVKSMNVQGGVCILDDLSRREVKDMLLETLRPVV